MGIDNIDDNNIDDIDIDDKDRWYRYSWYSYRLCKYMHTNTLMSYLEALSLWLGLVNCGFSCSMS